MLTSERFKVEILDARAPISKLLLANRIVEKNAPQLYRQRFVGIYVKVATTILRELPKHLNIAEDRRNPGGHRLKNWDTETLILRRKHKSAGATINRPKTAIVEIRTNVKQICDLQLGRQTVQKSTFTTVIADNHGRHGDARQLQRVDRTQQDVIALSRFQMTDRQHIVLRKSQTSEFRFGDSRSLRIESGQIDAIVDNTDVSS